MQNVLPITSPDIEYPSQFVSVTFPASFPSSCPSPSSQGNMHFNLTRVLLILRAYPSLLILTFSYPKLFKYTASSTKISSILPFKRGVLLYFPSPCHHTGAEHHEGKITQRFRIFGARLTWTQTWFCCLLAVWPWASNEIFQTLSFYIYITVIIIPIPCKAFVRIK